MPVLIPLYMFISYYRNYLERFASAALSHEGKKPEGVNWVKYRLFYTFMSRHNASQRVQTHHITLLYYFLLLIFLRKEMVKKER